LRIEPGAKKPKDPKAIPRGHESYETNWSNALVFERKFVMEIKIHQNLAKNMLSPLILPLQNLSHAK